MSRIKENAYVTLDVKNASVTENAFMCLVHTKHLRLLSILGQPSSTPKYWKYVFA